MKNILILCAAAIGLTFNVNADYNTTTSSLTNLIAAATTNTVNTAAFVATTVGQVVITPSFNLTTNGTGTAAFVFGTSIDGTTFDGPTYTVNVAEAGTTTVSVSSNINIGAFGFMRLNSIANPSAAVLTNAVIKYTVKPFRQDGQ